jgi:hypothetical protein
MKNIELTEQYMATHLVNTEHIKSITQEIDKFFSEQILGIVTLSLMDYSYSPEVINRLRKFGQIYIKLPTEAEIVYMARQYKQNGYTVKQSSAQEVTIQVTI